MQLQFAFEKRNYILLLIGVVVVILGFTLMSGGGSDDPNVFKGDYELSDASFEQMTNEFEVASDITSKLEPLRNQTFGGEKELMEAIQGKLTPQEYDHNYFSIRSATEIHADIFNARRITIAPIIVLLGYAFILYAIMWKRREGQPV